MVSTLTRTPSTRIWLLASTLTSTPSTRIWLLASTLTSTPSTRIWLTGTALHDDVPVISINDPSLQPTRKKTELCFTP